ncbi:hypothetical protein Ae717Ps2_6413c [Pseudonocardia sp. Ae717_Ps2]|nr:hypothetical protein Ae717Ps2_6413c [Pseudonocardia sp. Ae717_Ps2]
MSAWCTVSGARTVAISHSGRPLLCRDIDSVRRWCRALGVRAPGALGFPGVRQWPPAGPDQGRHAGSGRVDLHKGLAALGRRARACASGAARPGSGCSRGQGIATGTSERAGDGRSGVVCVSAWCTVSGARTVAISHSGRPLLCRDIDSVRRWCRALGVRAPGALGFPGVRQWPPAGPDQGRHAGSGRVDLHELRPRSRRGRSGPAGMPP